MFVCFFNITFQYNNIQKEFQSALKVNVLLATYKVTKTEHTRGFDATVCVIKNKQIIWKMANNNLLATRSMALIIKYIHITPEKHKYIYFLRNKKYAIKKKPRNYYKKLYGGLFYWQY